MTYVLSYASFGGDHLGYGKVNGYPVNQYIQTCEACPVAAAMAKGKMLFIDISSPFSANMGGKK